jgi:GNAT superfamily N-acetyltransferase
LNFAQCVGYTVTEVTLGDNLEEIITVVNSAYKHVPYLQEGTTRITRLELENIIHDSTKRLYICKDDNNTICGTALLDIEYHDPEMSLFSVDPRHQGKNIGKIILQYIETQILNMGKKRLTIKVIRMTQDKLIAYYQKNGFEFTGDSMVIETEILERYMKQDYWPHMRFEIMTKEVNL